MRISLHIYQKRFYFLIKSSFVFLLGFFLWGCATEFNIATQKEERIFYSTEREIRLGESMSRQVEKRYKLAEAPLMQKRVSDIGQRLVEVCDRQGIRYHFKVLDEEEVNAFALPGGFVYVNKALLENVENDDQLACVLAHEIGHIVARHSVKKLQAVMGYTIFRIVLVQTPAHEIGQGLDLAFSEILTGYSREDEILADRLAVRYAKLADFNPQEMLSFLEKLKEIDRKKPLRPISYHRTHPYYSERVKAVKEELGENIEFVDYINR